MPRRVRLDQLLVQRSLAPSRQRAQVLILGGAVRVDGRAVQTRSRRVAVGETVTVDVPPLDAGSVEPDPTVEFVVVHGPRVPSRSGSRLHVPSIGCGPSTTSLSSIPNTAGA